MMDAREATLKLLEARVAGASICPSEVARIIAPKEQWRAAMPAVHSAIDILLSEGLVTLSWKGHDLDERSGPYRICRRLRSGTEA